MWLYKKTYDLKWTYDDDDVVQNIIEVQNNKKEWAQPYTSCTIKSAQTNLWAYFRRFILHYFNIDVSLAIQI